MIQIGRFANVQCKFQCIYPIISSWCYDLFQSTLYMLLYLYILYFLQIPLPDSVTRRYYHTVSSFVLDRNHVFLIIVGGGVKAEQKDVGGGVMKWYSTLVTDPNITMVVELGNINYLFMYNLMYYCTR